jgi:hypothetical protein
MPDTSRGYSYIHARPGLFFSRLHNVCPVFRDNVYVVSHSSDNRNNNALSFALSSGNDFGFYAISYNIYQKKPIK